MNNYSSTPNTIILISILTWGLFYFVGLALPEQQHDTIKLGYDTCLFGLILGYTLKQKKVQQLIGLLIFIFVYNLDLLKRGPFQLPQTSYFYYFAKHYSFYLIVLVFLLYLPTSFEKYKLPPLTNETNFKNSTVIVFTMVLVIIFQASVRLF